MKATFTAVPQGENALGQSASYEGHFHFIIEMDNGDRLQIIPHTQQGIQYLRITKLGVLNIIPVLNNEILVY